MKDPIRPVASGAAPLTDRQINGFLALCAGIVCLAGPRKTRPLAGFLYGLFLSRGQGGARARLEATLLRLFDERESVRDDIQRGIIGQRINAEHFDRLFAELSERLDRLDAPRPEPLADGFPR